MRRRSARAEKMCKLNQSKYATHVGEMLIRYILYTPG